MSQKSLAVTLASTEGMALLRAWRSAPAPVPRHNFYGFKTDFLHTDADIGTAKAEYDFSDAIVARDQLRYADYRRDFFTSQAELPSSVLPTTPLSAVMVNMNEFSGFSHETMLQNQ